MGNSSMETVVYDQSALQKVDLRQTASLRFNNLSYGANHLVYSHRNEVWLMPEPTAAIPKPSPEKFPYADSQLVLQSKICAFEDFALVVIGCAGSLQIWNSRFPTQLTARRQRCSSCLHSRDCKVDQ